MTREEVRSLVREEVQKAEQNWNTMLQNEIAELEPYFTAILASLKSILEAQKDRPEHALVVIKGLQQAWGKRLISRYMSTPEADEPPLG